MLFRIDTEVGPVASLCPQRVDGLMTPRELRWLGPLSRYLFVIAMYTFYILSQVPNTNGNKTCRSPDADAKGLEAKLGPLNIVRFRLNNALYP